MKKAFSLFVLFIVATHFAFAGDIVTKDVMKLPLTARNFINQYFSTPQIDHIQIENEVLQAKNYQVKLTNGAEIDFDAVGNWTEVDCKKAPVPVSLVPDFVKQYMKSSGFSKESVTKIDRARKGYEVKLNSGLGLKFSKDGKFRKADH